MAVTYGLSLNMLQVWAVWNFCTMESKIISVERMFQYTSIPSEPSLVIESSRPDHTWPSQGEVEIHNLQVLSVIVVWFNSKYILLLYIYIYRSSYVYDFHALLFN